MTSFTGMDVGQVESLAGKLRTAADGIDAVVATITSLIGDAGHVWRGHDLDLFQQWWHDKHRPHLQQVAESIRGLGQSAHNNAADQRQASGESGGPGAAGSAGEAATVGAAGMVGAVGAGAVGATAVNSPVAGAVRADPAGGLAGSHRTWQQVDADYRSKAAGLGVRQPYRAGGAYEYQCTAWAQYRWHELGYSGPVFDGNGGEVAANAAAANGEATSGTPSLGALASYSGHVMVVEEVQGDRFRVSEMNTDSDWQTGHANEYRDSSWFHRTADGGWQRDGGGAVRHVTFAALPDRP
jgi:surface antigen/uncharacterized protein YukE